MRDRIATHWGRHTRTLIVAAISLSSSLLASFSVMPRAQAASLPSPLTTVGNHLTQNGQVFMFHGVNRDTLEWGQYNWGGCGGDGHFSGSDFAALSAWKVNTVRIPLSQADWLGRRCNAAAYRTMVDNVVALAVSYGMYVILDLHWSDVQGKAPCDAGCLSGQQPMPDADSISFWQQVAARYASNSAVLFDLYNEPHDVSWSCWRNGGCTAHSSTPNPQTGQPVSYKAVGMQQLYNTVRQYAPGNVILVAGLNWAYDLSGIGAGYAIAGKNIVYDTHVYTQWHNTQSDWSQHFGYLTRLYPVSATEWGSTDCSMTVSGTLLSYLDAPDGNAANRMSWTIWSWNDPGDCSQPTVLADWNGTPMPGQGQMVHDQLLSYP